MKTFQEPVIEVTVFAVDDVITLSNGDHDNGFIDFGELFAAIFRG